MYLWISAIENDEGHGDDSDDAEEADGQDDDGEEGGADAAEPPGGRVRVGVAEEQGVAGDVTELTGGVGGILLSQVAEFVSPKRRKYKYFTDFLGRQTSFRRTRPVSPPLALIKVQFLRILSL